MIANSSTTATAAMATGAAQEQLVWDAEEVVELCECVSCILDRCVCARDWLAASNLWRAHGCGGPEPH